MDLRTSRAVTRECYFKPNWCLLLLIKMCLAKAGPALADTMHDRFVSPKVSEITCPTTEGQETSNEALRVNGIKEGHALFSPPRERSVF